MLTLALLFGAYSVTVHAQHYSLEWFTIAAGGGASSGGQFSVSGTIAQPSAGAMSGGNYSLQGGFWGIIAVVPTPGAPQLSIVYTAANTVAISWPSPSTGWTLQQNDKNLDPQSWGTVTSGIQGDGSRRTLVTVQPIGNRFYRLILEQ